MKTVSLSDIQKNIGIFSHQKEPWSVIDKRKNQVISTIYPKSVTSKKSLTDQLSGCLSKHIKTEKQLKSWEEIRGEAKEKYFSEKYL